MLVGFEEFTVELNDKEIAIANRVVTGLKKRVGAVNSITNKQIRMVLGQEGTAVADATMRKIIEYIRQHNLVPKLCSNSKGYFIAATAQEWEDWKMSFRQRIKSMQYTLHCATQGESERNF